MQDNVPKKVLGWIGVVAFVVMIVARILDQLDTHDKLSGSSKSHSEKAQGNLDEAKVKVNSVEAVKKPAE